MAMPTKLNLTILQGSTFSEIIRWEDYKKVYKPITGITQAGPVVITSPTHAVPDGWRVRVTGVGGMKEINSAETYRKATLLTTNTIEINEINSSLYTAYTTGGVLEYNEPMDLAGYTARMQVRTKIGSTTFLTELTTENGGIVLNNTNKTIKLLISATNTALIDWSKGVYSLELISGAGIVYTLLTGNITVKNEVTR